MACNETATRPSIGHYTRFLTLARLNFYAYFTLTWIEYRRYFNRGSRHWKKNLPLGMSCILFQGAWSKGFFMGWPL